MTSTSTLLLPALMTFLRGRENYAGNDVRSAMILVASWKILYYAAFV